MRAVSMRLILVCLFAPGLAYGARVDFETIPPGIRFGGVIKQPPGTHIFSQEGIRVSVETFYFDGGQAFERAQIGGEFADQFDTTPLQLHRISARFDFSRLDFPVNIVTLEYKDFGQVENFAVNDGPIWMVEDLERLPTFVARDVVLSVNNGFISLLGPVQSIQIGGDSLGIDNVIAVPEPGTIALLTLAGCTLLRPRNRRRPG